MALLLQGNVKCSAFFHGGVVGSMEVPLPKSSSLRLCGRLERCVVWRPRAHDGREFSSSASGALTGTRVVDTAGSGCLSCHHCRGLWGGSGQWGRRLDSSYSRRQYVPSANRKQLNPWRCGPAANENAVVTREVDLTAGPLDDSELPSLAPKPPMLAPRMGGLSIKSLDEEGLNMVAGSLSSAAPRPPPGDARSVKSGQVDEATVGGRPEAPVGLTAPAVRRPMVTLRAPQKVPRPVGPPVRSAPPPAQPPQVPSFSSQALSPSPAPSTQSPSPAPSMQPASSQPSFSPVSRLESPPAPSQSEGKGVWRREVHGAPAHRAKLGEAGKMLKLPGVGAGEPGGRPGAVEAPLSETAEAAAESNGSVELFSRPQWSVERRVSSGPRLSIKVPSVEGLSLAGPPSRPAPKQLERPARQERPTARLERTAQQDRPAAARPATEGTKEGEKEPAAGTGGSEELPDLLQKPSRHGAATKELPGRLGDKWVVAKRGSLDAGKRKPGPSKRGGDMGKEEDDDGGRMLSEMGVSIAGVSPARRPGQKRRKGQAARARQRAARAGQEQQRVEIVEVGPAGMPVPELADKLAVNAADVVKALFMKGILATVNQALDEATVRVVCAEYEVEVLEAGSVPPDELAKKTSEFIDEEDLDSLQLRPPVVTIMGHVDHGKTSLLDHIRNTKVAQGEAGGITQGIGAYSVPVSVAGEESTVVFLDTPGHEAFSAMRARGARVTDIAIIVVAADDGVRPQTIEAISHAKAAEVPIVVAINKIDKEGADPERVKQELTAHGLMPEEWGGKTPMVAVSAKKGTGIDELLETLLLVAEVEELSANPDRSACGTVIEASLDKKRGALATVLIQNGTLRRGDVLLCGEAYGKVRSLTTDKGKRVDKAGPSMAVQVLGLHTVPVAGDAFEACDDLEAARVRALALGEQLNQQRLAAQAGEGKVTLQTLTAAANMREEGLEFAVLNLVVKVDAAGSADAVRSALEALPQNTINLRFLMLAPGDITKSDVDLAAASEAIVLGFNTSVTTGTETHAKEMGVELRTYKVIYDLVDDVRRAMEGMMDEEEERIPIGAAEVKAVFGAGSGKAAGCVVTDGKLLKGCLMAVERKGKEVYVGEMESLRRVKENVKEVAQGLECGVSSAEFVEWRPGDIIKAYEVVMKQRTLESASAVSTRVLDEVASDLGAKS